MTTDPETHTVADYLAVYTAQAELIATTTFASWDIERLLSQIPGERARLHELAQSAAELERVDAVMDQLLAVCSARAGN